MGMFDFFKDAGEKLANAVGISDANAGEALKAKVESYNFGVEDLTVSVEGDKVTLGGVAPTPAAAEKAILAAGNINGVAHVESILTIAQAPAPEADAPAAPAMPEPVFYTVQRGDNLSKIAKAFYGNANRYPEIFEANKPMLTHPDKIYPGQSLRIPGAEMKAAAA